MSGTKHDQDKPAYHLIDARFDLEVLGAASQWPRPLPHPERVLADWTQGVGGEADLVRCFWAVVSIYGTNAPIQLARVELARVLTFGAKKYAPNNWKGGFAWSRLWRAAYGHIESHKRGDIYDEETGFLHLSHALCMLMFLIVHVRDGLGDDDRGEVWPNAGAEVEAKDRQVVHDCGVVFHLESHGASIAVWRAVMSRAMLLLSPKGEHRWQEHISPTERDVRAVADDGFIERLRAASWPK